MMGFKALFIFKAKIKDQILTDQALIKFDLQGAD
jgi:hypothetical protein